MILGDCVTYPFACFLCFRGKNDGFDRPPNTRKQKSSTRYDTA